MYPRLCVCMDVYINIDNDRQSTTGSNSSSKEQPNCKRSRLCMYVCIYLCMHIYIYIRVYMCIYIYIYIYICIYINIEENTHTHTHLKSFDWPPFTTAGTSAARVCAHTNTHTLSHSYTPEIFRLCSIYCSRHVCSMCVRTYKHTHTHTLTHTHLKSFDWAPITAGGMSAARVSTRASHNARSKATARRRGKVSLCSGRSEFVCMYVCICRHTCIT
jgi:hypothetical protein